MPRAVPDPEPLLLRIDAWQRMRRASIKDRTVKSNTVRRAAGRASEQGHSERIEFTCH